MAMIDEGISQVLEYIVPAVNKHRKAREAGLHGQVTQSSSGPFIFGLTGLQGSGKSTWASRIVKELNEKYQLNAITVSLDDFYQTHERLVAIATENPNNSLLRTRGQPGTHDEKLAAEFFTSLKSEAPATEKNNEEGAENDQVFLPAFDKSKFNGEGDRVPRDQWTPIKPKSAVDVVVFEGWCIGFQPLPREEVERKWRAAEDERSAKQGTQTDETSQYCVTTLADHALEDLFLINTNLERYCHSFMGPQHFDCMVHLDTEDLATVYTWRLQQEHALRAKSQRAMSDASVVAFVRGYMPAYELYLENLRSGFFLPSAKLEKGAGEEERKNVHVKVILDLKRRITSVTQLS